MKPLLLIAALFLCSCAPESKPPHYDQYGQPIDDGSGRGAFSM